MVFKNKRFNCAITKNSENKRRLYECFSPRFYYTKRINEKPFKSVSLRILGKRIVRRTVKLIKLLFKLNVRIRIEIRSISVKSQAVLRKFKINDYTVIKTTKRL